MAMITITSNGHTSLSQTLPDRNNNNELRAASFSSYLNSNEESFVRQLAASNPIMGGQDKNLCLERKGQEDGEIGVFSAEKYFNGAMDDSPRIVKVGARNYQQYLKDQERTDQTLVKPRVQAAGTPSIRSESSWNSQNALLQSVLKHDIPNPNPNPCSKKTNKLQGKSFFACLRCKRSCSDKDSVDTTEYGGQTIFKRSADNGTVQAKTINTTEPMRKTAVKENSFSLPSMNSETIKIHSQEVEEEEQRKSAEVFSCPMIEKKNKSLTIERKVTMFSRGDSSPRREEIEFTATSPDDKCFETESDASSDLFEIESLTGKGKVNPFLARQVSDATSECITPTAYAPSEASIEWSVVTASAADFSVMSDCEEVRASPVKTFSNVAKNRSTVAELPKGRRPGSILLGCKNEKVVRVAEDAHLTSLNQKANNNYEPRIRRMSDSFAPVPAAVTRLQAETKLEGFDSRQRQHALAAAAMRAHSLPRSISPRSSHLLYIQ
ncbi:protein PHYTOCHROME KINASE SUBSTRATE 1-like [Mangifera indica]|uniref:protein PHYTOCHROME KINASE SUBSTRATE 1-like n=1 Tax=Mangifera indica TaxID=29780 RepID=UPI001CFA55E8|nr:protein PHYTOCHROME KINASE SUBSTRATE 1-like [Mangifera indica]